MMDYKASAFSSSVLLPHELASGLATELFSQVPIMSAHSPDPFLELCEELEVHCQSRASAAVADCFSKVFKLLKDPFSEGWRTFPLSDELISALFQASVAVRDDSPLPTVVSRLLDILHFCLQSFPDSASAFLRLNVTELMAGILRDDWWLLSKPNAVFQILTVLASHDRGFIESLWETNPEPVAMLVQNILGYADVHFPEMIPHAEDNFARQCRDYLEVGLPLLVHLLAIPAGPDQLIEWFGLLQRIGREPFAFDPQQPPPIGISVPIVTSLIRCFARIGERLEPALFNQLIREPDSQGREYYTEIFWWPQYVNPIAIADRALLEEIVCCLIPLFMVCIQNDPPVFLAFCREGLLDFLVVPVMAGDRDDGFIDSCASLDIGYFDSRPFVVTQKHINEILDLIIMILCKIAYGEITEPSPHYFQDIFADALRLNLSARRSETRSRILTAFAAIAVDSEESTKQHIILDFGCLSGMIDLLDDVPPETAALLVRALALLLNHAVLLGEDAGMRDVVDGFDPEDIETTLPESAHADFEQLCAAVRALKATPE
jgi:hypothetical protein